MYTHVYEYIYIYICVCVCVCEKRKKESDYKRKIESWFGWVGFYGISTIVGYLMPNPLYTYILNIYDLVWLGFMAYQPL